MSLRKGLIGAAAVAALAVCGVARADEQPFFMAEAAPQRAPLMALLNKVGAADPLEKAGITVGGRVEGSYTYSMSNPPGNVIAGRVFDFENQDLTLNQVGVFVDKGVDTSKFDIGGRMEWIYGGDARLIHSLGLFDHQGVGPNDLDNQWDLNQLYVDVSFGGGWKARVGKFVALAGQEVIDPTGNRLYSHSYLFGYAIPFTHTGVLVTHTVDANLEYSFGISRGWDTSLEDNNDTIDFLGQLKLNLPDRNTSIIVNVTSGADQPGDNDNWRTLVDLILTTKAGDNLELAINADWAYERNSHTAGDGSDAQWFGVAVYGTVVFSPQLSLTARAEYFNDEDGARLGGGAGVSVYEGTVGLNFTPFANDPIGKGLVIRPEVRLDYANHRFFDGGTDNYQVTAAVDAYFKF
ncbi:MAG TPA: outer membrane beta-barrel protein [Humisphaera sp.]